MPDEKTIWLFREELSKKKLVDELFEMFGNYITNKGYILGNGKILDASFVEVPKQNNTKKEQEYIKAGLGEELWEDNWNKKSHKDIDAR